MNADGESTSITGTVAKVVLAVLLMLLAVVIADYTGRHLDNQSTTASPPEEESRTHRRAGD
jgi:hypothetical protein